MTMESTVRARYQAAKQEHVLKYLDEGDASSCSSSQKRELLEQLNDIRVEEIAGLFRLALSASDCGDAGGDGESPNKDSMITPFSKSVGQYTDPDVGLYYDKGMEAIASGQVAALVLAGGQGTRLGFDGPKGMYNIGLPSGRSLFQLLCERLQRLELIAATSLSSPSSSGTDAATPKRGTIPFYIMTSPINHDQTVEFFHQNAYFGLSETNVKFFQQGMLPCLTEDGKIIMETPYKVSMAPDGNGGIYPSLKKSGMLDDMTDRGIKYLHVFSIDNALTKIADPTFIGYCIIKDADCGNKSVWKAGPHEKVGVIAEKGGKPCVVEYSEITTEMAERIGDDGRLMYGAANICSHFYTLNFLRDVVVPNLDNLYHVARKKIPYYDDATQQTITPESNNGIKLESFIFDIFPLSERMAVFSGKRDDEFAPVKNAPGSPVDSPDTARAYLSNQAMSWVEKAGGVLLKKPPTENEGEGEEEIICEISPLTSYDGEGLEELVKGKEIDCPFIF